MHETAECKPRALGHFELTVLTLMSAALESPSWMSVIMFRSSQLGEERRQQQPEVLCRPKMLCQFGEPILYVSAHLRGVVNAESAGWQFLLKCFKDLVASKSTNQKLPPVLSSHAGARPWHGHVRRCKDQ